MQKFMLKMFKKTIISWVLSLINSQSFKKRFAERINKIVNIPGLNEKEEEVIFLRTYEAVVELIESSLNE